MRYWCYYILKHLQKLPTNLKRILHRYFNVGNVITFRWGNVMRKLIRELKIEVKRLNGQLANDTQSQIHKKRPLIVLNSIDWDLISANTFGYLKQFLQLAQVLEPIVMANRTRILYLSGVTTPQNKVKDAKNIFILKALNKVVLDKMSAIGVETLDINSMLHSVYDLDVEQGHY